MERLPADKEGPAHANALKSINDYQESLNALHALRDDALWDIELIKKRDETSRQ